MKNTLAHITAATLMGSAAFAGGLDRNGQPLDIIFEDGTYAEFSFGYSKPDLEGTDLATRGPTGNVGESFNAFALGYKTDITDQLSVSVIYDQPFGVDISYPLQATSPLLGGTKAYADVEALTGILRYKFTDRFSAHGGIRAQRASGDITLNGLAYGPLNGYRVQTNTDTAVGFVVGAAYEIPDIAMRLALTYNSEIDHDFKTTESLAPGFAGQTTTTTPQSVNVDFQTGVAKDTLMFAKIRWADFSETKLKLQISGVDLIDLEDSLEFTLGVARQLNDNWVASLAYTREEPQSSDLVSPLGPTNGTDAVTLGLRYQQGKVRITTGLRYSMFGDAFAETGTPDTARASFTDSSALSFGLKIGYQF